MGALSKREFCALLDEFKPIMPILPKIHVIGTTAEGERVAVEARGEGRLANGRPYENTYHFLFVFRDALIHEVKEYHGTKYALEAMSL
jgi:ketosteroid isomerase-like protein